jgi:hypothetical protein
VQTIRAWRTIDTNLLPAVENPNSGDKSDLVGVDPHDPTTTSKPEVLMQSLNQLSVVTDLVGARSAWSQRSIPVSNRRTNKNLRRSILISLEGGVLNHRGQHVFCVGSGVAKVSCKTKLKSENKRGVYLNRGDATPGGRRGREQYRNIVPRAWCNSIPLHEPE